MLSVGVIDYLDVRVERGTEEGDHTLEVSASGT